MFRSHGKVQLWTQNQHSQVAVFVQTHLWFSSKSQPPSWHLRCCSCHLDACSIPSPQQVQAFLNFVHNLNLQHSGVKILQPCKSPSSPWTGHLGHQGAASPKPGPRRCCSTLQNSTGPATFLSSHHRAASALLSSCPLKVTWQTKTPPERKLRWTCPSSSWDQCQPTFPFFVPVTQTIVLCPSLCIKSCLQVPVESTNTHRLPSIKRYSAKHGKPLGQ